MNTRYRHYTAANVRLMGKMKNGRLYLNLEFNYGYVEERVVRGQCKRVYLPFVVSTGYSIDPSCWRDGDFTPEARKSMKRSIDQMTASIEEQRNNIFTTYRNLLNRLNIKPSPNQILRELRSNQTVTERTKLADFIRDYAESPACRSLATRKKYRTVADLIQVLEKARTNPQFGGRGRGAVYLNTFSYDDWHDFTMMLSRARTSIPLTAKGGKALEFIEHGTPSFYTESTAARYEKCVIAMLHRARKSIKGLKFDVDLSDLDRTTAKRDLQECLTPEELATILTRSCGQPWLDNVRKLFALQCFTGVRYSDLGIILKRPAEFLSPSKSAPPIKAIRFVTQKTGTPVTLPLFEPAQQLLEEPPHLISNQKYNDGLKLMAQTLLLDRPQQVIRRTADGTVTDSIEPLWRTLSSHSARRTYKTMLEGAPLFCSRTLVAASMGHVVLDRSADLGYFSLTPDQKAQALVQQCRLNAAQLPFSLIADLA